MLGDLDQMNSQENGLIDTLRSANHNNTPTRRPEAKVYESYGMNSIVTDELTDKGMTMTMNSL